MPKLFTISKFCVKVGVLGGVIYSLKNTGVWDHSTETYKLSNQIIESLQPYIIEVKKELPTQFQNLPSSNDVSRSMSTYWNIGIISTVSFVKTLPNRVISYSDRGINYLTNEIIQYEKKLSPSE